ncbi:response regulator [Candidatus Sumerlaeota bacterium]|nr:response regulator [Candidatus Sumerlaeota bacterium]
MSHRVLLVDDDRRLLEGIKRALRKEPYEILTADSAEEGLRLLQSERIDAVISDQNMPGMCGVDFLSRVSKERPHTVRFIMTGQATLEVAIEAINEGAITRFFTKPWNPVDLVVSLRQALEQKDLMDRARRLLEASRKQSAVIERIEKESPGITKVRKDSEGRLILDGAPCGYEDLLREISDQADAAEKQLKWVDDWDVRR